MAQAQTTATVILAGGCFWCLEHDMRELKGVVAATSGYSGGERNNPTYENYHDTDSAHPTPHVEVVQVEYDPAVLSYQNLLDYYFRHIDPTDNEGQFCDRGPAYRPVIYVANEEEKTIATRVSAEVAKTLNQEVKVDILPARAFWAAEDYHQHYATKNSVKYKFYRWNCGRDKQIEKVWGGAR